MRQQTIERVLFSAVFLAFLDCKFKLQEKVCVSEAVLENVTTRMSKDYL